MSAHIQKVHDDPLGTGLREATLLQLALERHDRLLAPIALAIEEGGGRKPGGLGLRDGDGMRMGDGGGSKRAGGFRRSQHARGQFTSDHGGVVERSQGRDGGSC